MKIIRLRHGRRHLSTRLWSLLIALLLLPLILQAAPPQWWYDNKVIDLDKNLPANDYAAVNQGQVKFIAEQAAAEMDAHLPGGIVDPDGHIQTLLDTWGAPTALTNDFTAVNLGQLKALATPFYAELIRVGYVTDYPWAGHESLANNYAAANIGQVKNLFSFDLLYDGNGDGLPDWWENHYGLTGVSATGTVPWNPNLTYLQAFQQGLNPKDFYNNQAPAFAAQSGENQDGSPNEFLSAPLTVTVTVNGQPIGNAPVTFTVSKGAGKVQRSSNSTPGSSVTVLTDYSGLAKVYFRLSAGPNDQNEVIATPGSGSYSAITATYPETANGTAGSNPSPFAPSNITAAVNQDGSMDVSWTNNADDTADIPIQVDKPDGTWTTLITVPAGTTSVHIPAL